MNSIFENLQFPDPDRYLPVSLIPVYVAPLPYSGERLLVGVVTVTESGVQSFPLESLKRLACVYGPAHKGLLVARDIALASLATWVSTAGVQRTSEWIPPGDGMSLGQVLHTTAMSLADAVRTSFMEWSSLYASPNDLMDEEPQPREERLAGMSASRLETMVKTIVLNARPDVARRFSVAYRIHDAARPMRLGFVGDRLVANFALVIPTVLSAMVSNAKARLWDLASAKDGANTGWFRQGQTSSYELLLHRSTQADVQYSARQLALVTEAIAELEAEADRLDLRCRPLVGARAIAIHLMNVEALAA